MNKEKIMSLKIFDSDKFFYRFIRRIVFFLLNNQFKGDVQSYSLMKNCKCTLGANSMTIGKGGIIKNFDVGVLGENNKVILSNNISISYGLSVSIQGNNNIIEIGSNVHLYENLSKIRIIGNNCRIKIGEGLLARKIVLGCRDNHSMIDIGKNADIQSVAIACMEGGKVTIGDNCLISYDVEIRNSDGHSIIDEKGNRTNNAKDVVIGDGVWISQGVLILKGAQLPCGTIVGAKSIVTKIIETENSLVLGSPATVKRQRIYWKKERV